MTRVWRPPATAGVTGLLARALVVGVTTSAAAQAAADVSIAGVPAVAVSAGALMRKAAAMRVKI